MSNSDKFIAMIGFAKRARKIVYGLDKLKTSKQIKLLAVSDTASDNLLSEMNALADKKKCPIVYAAGLEISVGNNVKALGMTDSGMVSAAIEYVENGGDNRYKIRKHTK